MLTTVVVSAVTGFASGLIAWAAGVFLGKPLARFYDLRLEAHMLIFVCANITDQPSDRERAIKSQADLRQTAAEIDALRVVLPRLALRFLDFRDYKLTLATQGLTGLSNSLFASDGSKAFHRVTAQRGLRLPIDPSDQVVFDRRSRLEGVTI